MKVLVTGAGGFVGAALVFALATRGDVVVALDRGATPTPPGGRAYAIDVTSPGGLDAILSAERPDAVIIGAAITANRTREACDPASILAVNVGAVAETVRAAAAHGVRRVVYLGSAASYGESGRDATLLVEGETPLRPRSLYGISKATGEAVALRLGDTFDLDLTAIRLGTCFGPFERATEFRDTLSAPYQIKGLADAGRTVRLSRAGRKDWLYVRDAVAGIMAVLDAGALPHRVYNVSSGTEWTLADLCEAIAVRRPGFRWSVGGGRPPNIDLYDPFDRGPMSVARIAADTGWTPRFDLPAAATDWLDA